APAPLLDPPEQSEAGGVEELPTDGRLEGREDEEDPEELAPVHGPSPAAARMACQTRPPVAGMSSSRTPSGASALMTAFITAGSAPTVPASPAPLAPSGFSVVGRSEEHTSELQSR